MVQTTKTQPSDTLRGVALLDDPIRNKGTASDAARRNRCYVTAAIAPSGGSQDSGGTPIV